MNKQKIIEFIDDCVMTVSTNDKWMEFNILVKRHIKIWFETHPEYNSPIDIPTPVYNIIRINADRILKGSKEYALLMSKIKRYPN